MATSTVYVIHHAGKFWRRRHGHARSAWAAGLSQASLYRRVSDARRACARIEVEGAVEVWEVEMRRALIVHSAQNRLCPSVSDSTSDLP